MPNPATLPTSSVQATAFSQVFLEVRQGCAPIFLRTLEPTAQSPQSEAVAYRV